MPQATTRHATILTRLIHLIRLVIGIVTVGTVVYMHKIMIESLCPTPWEDTGKGLMSLAACCSDEIDGAVPCDYVG